jgi:ABC-2 type transport system ATP-binding protein
LAYISYGKLLARGTASELIEQSRLITNEISGPDLQRLAHALRELPSIKTVASFGAALHVSADSQSELDNALAPYQSGGFDIREVPTSLEDVFIALMKVSQDNYA